ncbi:MAG: right-handed parallel beta-helix repeat-containing protein [Synergistaceae bacterium]|nr:right-handed parallel beta-helix repeat-containing protein [Synergistaceae bacterium]
MRRSSAFFSIAALVLAVLCAPADAYLYLSVSGANVSIRAEAKMDGKILAQAKAGDVFIAEDNPVTNEADGSKWYKIVLTLGNDYALLKEDARFGVEAAYIGVSNAHTMRTAESENKKIASLLNHPDADEETKRLTHLTTFCSSLLIRATPPQGGNDAATKETAGAFSIGTAAGTANRIIIVEDAREFLEALGSDRIIELSPGRYNLSEWDPILNNQPEQAPPYPNLRNEGSPKLAKGVSWSDDPFDGGELVLSGISDLTIRSTGKGPDTLIVVDPRYAYVLKFVNCSGIVIENIAAGHSEGGYCSGGVFGFEDSSRITMTGSNMFGCGTEGLVLSNVSDMNVTASRIYGCTYDIMTVSGGENITFESCEFSDNQEFSLVNVAGTRNISFADCEFRDNMGSSMFAVDGTTVSVSNSAFIDNYTRSPIQDSDNVEFTNCTFDTAHAGDSAEDEGEVTLKDDNTGNTVTLYRLFSEEHEGLLFYHNNRFGYSVTIPEIFTEVILLPDNEDGLILASENGEYRFRVSGGFVIFEDELQTSMEAAKKYVEENVDGATIFEKTGDDWWELNWWNGPEKGVRKFLTDGGAWFECEITGPGQPNNGRGEYDELFERSLATMSFPVG